MYRMPEKEEMDRECRKLMAHFREDDDYWGDYDNFNKCIQALNPYERDKAIAVLKYLIEQYKLQIDEWAYLNGGRYLQDEGLYDAVSNRQITEDLRYIGEHIPAFALMREGKQEEAAYLMNWIEKQTCHCTQTAIYCEWNSKL